MNEQINQPVSLQVDRLVVDRIVKARIEAEVVQAMGGQDALVNRVVTSFLTTKVNRDGNESGYSSENNQTLLEWMVKSSLRAAAVGILKELIEQRKDQLEKALRTELTKQSTNLAHLLVEGVKTAIQLDHVEITFKQTKREKE